MKPRIVVEFIDSGGRRGGGGGGGGGGRIGAGGVREAGAEKVG